MLADSIHPRAPRKISSGHVDRESIGDGLSCCITAEVDATAITKKSGYLLAVKCTTVPTTVPDPSTAPEPTPTTDPQPETESVGEGTVDFF